METHCQKWVTPPSNPHGTMPAALRRLRLGHGCKLNTALCARLSQYTGEPGTKAHTQCSYCSTPHHTKSLCFQAFLRSLSNTAARIGQNLGNYNPVYILLVKSTMVKNTKLGDFNTEDVLSRCSFAICSIYSAKSNLQAVTYHFSIQGKKIRDAKI